MPLAQRYTLTPASRILGVTTDCIKRWERAGKIPPAHRDASNVRWWSKAELERIREWIEQRRQLARGCAS